MLAAQKHRVEVWEVRVLRELEPWYLRVAGLLLVKGGALIHAYLGMITLVTGLAASYEGRQS